MRFDRDRFFQHLRAWRGALTPQQVRGFNFILDAVERDPHVKSVSWLAYMLATAWHETAFTMQPIHEYGGKAYFIRNYGGQTRKGRELGNDTPEEGFDYAGQGFVQLTGESNYEKSEEALRREYPQIITEFEQRTGKRFDLTVGDQPDDKSDPTNAQDPAIAYAIMSYGMRVGLFTGRKLANYFNSVEEDPFNARKIINGLDHADAIARYYAQFKRILQNALIRETTPENVGAVIDAIRTDSPVAVQPSPDSGQAHPLNDQQQPAEKPSAEQPASIFNTVEAAFNKVDPLASKVSGSSWATVIIGGIISGFTIIWNAIKENPIETAIGAALLLGFLAFLHFSKERGLKKALAERGQ